MFFAIGTQGALAQLSTGDIVGSVTDATGAVVPNASIVVTNVDTGVTRTITASSAGEYTATLLDPGTYTVHVQATGFKAFEAKGNRLSAGDRLRVDAALATGGASETISVTASSSAELQTDSSTVQSSISSTAVSDLPMNGRNFIALVQMQPGVTPGNPGSVASGGAPDDRRQGSNFSANGQYDAYNNNLIDGLDNNERQQGLLGVRPSIDAIAEIKVFTTNYPAEVGRASGAVVNVLTKAGTNQFHGTAFEFLRNDYFDTRDYFATTGPKPEYRQHQFGGSIGGPIFHNKAFFFGAVEDTRIIQGKTFLRTVPTLFEEQNPGDFSDVGGPVLTPEQISPWSESQFFQRYAASALHTSSFCPGELT